MVSVTGDTPLKVAVEMMLNRHIHRLLVVRDKGSLERPAGCFPCGMLSAKWPESDFANQVCSWVRQWALNWFET